MFQRFLLYFFSSIFMLFLGNFIDFFKIYCLGFQICLRFFCWIFYGLFGFFLNLPRLLLKVTNVTNGHQKYPKISQNRIIIFFCPKNKKSPWPKAKRSAGARSRPAQRAVSSSTSDKRGRGGAKGHPSNADVIYGDEDSNSPSTLVFAALESKLRI